MNTLASVPAPLSSPVMVTTSYTGGFRAQQDTGTELDAQHKNGRSFADDARLKTCGLVCFKKSFRTSVC